MVPAFFQLSFARRLAWLTRGLLATAMLALMAATGASCVGVLSLDNRSGAVSELCAKLAECFGQDYYPSCVKSGEARLAAASADERAAWLRAFSDNLCLQDCISARRCLDLMPVCGSGGESCEQLEQCCGFISGEGVCGDAANCCRPRGIACSSDAECCEGSCENGTCGGVVCKKGGEKCTYDGDCCTQICDSSKLCASEVCLPEGSPCGSSSDCCVQDGLFCEGAVVAQDGMDGPAMGVCRPQSCLPLTGDCSEPGARCCEGLDCYDIAFLGATLCLEGACLPEGYPCERNTDCCESVCSAGICASNCLPATFPCGAADSCCGDMLCGGPDITVPTCCRKDLDNCQDSAECCSGNCNSSGQCEPNQPCLPPGGSCQGAADCCASNACFNNQCCSNTGTHSVCVTGKPLYSACLGANCMPTANDCVGQICAKAPSCCCSGWDQSCVDLVATTCSIVCPIAGDPIQPNGP